MTSPIATASLMQHMAAQVAAPSATAAGGGLAASFEALMHRPSMPPAIGNEETAQTLSKMVLVQDDELQRAVADSVAITDAAPSMSMQELQAAGMRMSLELAGMQMDMQAKMAVVDSTKSAIETLMRQE
jgi:type III secretion inner rod protein HrpB2